MNIDVARHEHDKCPPESSRSWALDVNAEAPHQFISAHERLKTERPYACTPFS
jgi:hypothetical protein